MCHVSFPVVLLIGVFDPNQTIPVPYTPQSSPAAAARRWHTPQEGRRPRQRRQRAQAACSELQHPQEGEQTAFSPFLAISHLLPASVPITVTLSSGPSLHVLCFSRAFPGFGSPSEVLQAV